MRRLIPRAMALALALAPPAVGRAASADVDCDKAISTPDVSTADLELCRQRDLDAVAADLRAATARLRAADARLNAAYRAALAWIDGGGVRTDVGMDWRKALVEAQRRWIAFRDAECVAAGYAWQGSAERPIAAVNCQAALSDARTGQLRAYAGAK